MTYNPLDREDQIHNSGVTGYELTFGAATPSQGRTTTSGGGAIDYQQVGAVVKPGTTSGDHAGLRGITLDNPDSGSITAIVQEFVIMVRSTALDSFNDDFLLGVVNDGSYPDDKSGSVGYDLTTQEFRVDTTTHALPASTLTNVTGYFRMVHNYQDNETYFELELGGASDSATLTGTAAKVWYDFLYGQSNGNGDEFGCIGVRTAVYPDTVPPY